MPFQVLTTNGIPAIPAPYGGRNPVPNSGREFSHAPLVAIRRADFGPRRAREQQPVVSEDPARTGFAYRQDAGGLILVTTPALEKRSAMHAMCEIHGSVNVACPRCAGVSGGRVGGKSRSPRRLAACRANARRAREALRQKRAALEARPTPLPRIHDQDARREIQASPPRAEPGNRIHEEIKAAIEASRLAAESWTKCR